MKVVFYKYQGTGNDFIFIDNRKNQIGSLSQKQVGFLCHRRFGIGADGLMLLNPHEKLDFTMVYYNSDGNISSMCGNGGRCITAFAHQVGQIKDRAQFQAVDGIHDAVINTDGTVSLKMIDVQSVEKNDNFYFLNTGSPHYVQFVKDIEKFDVFGKGRAIRNNERFKKEGTNVNFVEILSPDSIFVRTYERGVEDETYSCGTGVTASAISAGFELDNNNNSFNIKALGGNLNVRYQKQNNTFSDIWLTGPATYVFSGEIDV
jgi:diaminopimelate epimerase